MLSPVFFDFEFYTNEIEGTSIPFGEPPARFPQRKTSRRDVLRPFCALCRNGISRPAGRRSGSAFGIRDFL